MKKLKYKIKDELGMHARPAGQLVKKLKEFTCTVSIGRDEQMVDAKRIFSVMSLGMKCGEELVLMFDGIDEDIAITETASFLSASL